MVDQCGRSFTTPIDIDSTQAIAMGVLSRLNGRLLFNTSDFSLSYHPLEEETRICFQVHVRNFKFRGSRIPKQNFRASALINVSIVGECSAAPTHELIKVFMTGGTNPLENLSSHIACDSLAHWYT